MLQKRALSCKLFDSLLLKGREGDIEGLITLAEELVNCEYAHFNINFIEDMEK